MGNIQSEVFPINFISRRRKELHAVNRISMHHPARPQMKKFFLIVVIVFIGLVCAEIALLFTATAKSAIRIVELARKRLIGDLAVTGIRNLHLNKQNRTLRSSNRQLCWLVLRMCVEGAVNSNTGTLRMCVEGL